MEEPGAEGDPIEPESTARLPPAEIADLPSREDDASALEGLSPGAATSPDAGAAAAGSKDDTIAGLKRANGTLRRQLQEFSAALDAALQQKRRPKSREKDAALLQSAVMQAEKRNKVLQKEVIALTTKLDNADVEKLNALEAEVFKKTQQVADLEAQLKNSQRAQRQLEKDLIKATPEEMQSQLRAALDEAAAMKKQNRSLQVQHAADQRAVKDKSDGYEDMAAKLKKADVALKAAGVTEGAAAALETLRAEGVAKDKKIEELGHAIKVLQKQAETDKKRLAQTGREYDARVAAAKEEALGLEKSLGDKDRELRVAAAKLREALASASRPVPPEDVVVLQRMVAERDTLLAAQQRDLALLPGAMRRAGMPRLPPSATAALKLGGSGAGPGMLPPQARSAPHTQRMGGPALRPGGPRKPAGPQMELLDGPTASLASLPTTEAGPSEVRDSWYSEGGGAPAGDGAGEEALSPAAAPSPGNPTVAAPEDDVVLATSLEDGALISPGATAAPMVPPPAADAEPEAEYEADYEPDQDYEPENTAGEAKAAMEPEPAVAIEAAPAQEAAAAARIDPTAAGRSLSKKGSKVAAGSKKGAGSFKAPA